MVEVLLWIMATSNVATCAVLLISIYRKRQSRKRTERFHLDMIREMRGNPLKSLPERWA